MKNDRDNATPDILHKRGRGRPRKPDALTPAERSRRYRQRKRDAEALAHDNPELGMRWYNGMTRIDRAWWHGRADSAAAVDAFAAYVRENGLPDWDDLPDIEHP